jgi:hypothetical protein
MKMRKIFILTLAILIFSFSLSFSEEASFFLGVRPAGMGSAFVAVSDDENAIFFNPAGIKKQNNWRVLGPIFKLGDDIRKLKDLSDAMDKANTNQERADVIDDFIPLNVLVEGNMFPVYLNEEFSLGLFSGIKTRVEVLNPVQPRIEISGFTDTTLIYSCAQNLDKKTSLGVSIKAISRKKIMPANTPVDTRDPENPDRDVVVITQTDLLNYNKTDFEIKDFYKKIKGEGLSFNIGLLHNLNKKITLGAMISDFGGTKINYGNTTSQIPSALRLGISYRIPLNNKEILTALDISEFGKAGSFYKKLHLGSEFSLNGVNLRLGINQGYPVFGMGIKIGYFKFGYAYYQEERGRYAGELAEKSHLISMELNF